MANEEFNRNDYMGGNNPPPRRPSPIAGILLNGLIIGLLLTGLYFVIGVYGFPGDSLLQQYGLPAIGGRFTSFVHHDSGREQAKLARGTHAQDRHRAKKRLGAQSHGDQEGGSSQDSVLQNAPPPFRINVYPPRALSSPDAVSLPDTSVSLRRSSKSPSTSRKPTVTQVDNQADRQVWEATADRLGDVVGQLNEQQNQIIAARDGIDKLAAHMDQSRLSFRVARKGGPFQVGPVKLRLTGTDVKQQRYSMRMFVDDHWVELKDRAAEEEVRFALPGVTDGFSLVVSQVYKGQVEGYLLIPKITASGMGSR